MSNPFELVTSSKLSAEEALELWCDDKRLDRVQGGESCFIMGNRGAGKSMLFRMLQPDCQSLMHPNKKPSFLSVYFAVRDSDLMIEELNLMRNKQQISSLSESHLVMTIMRQFFVEIIKTPGTMSEIVQQDFQHLVANRICSAFDFSLIDEPPIKDNGFTETIEQFIEIMDHESQRLKLHVLEQLYSIDSGYNGPLFFFDSLLGPIADFLLKEIGCSFYILIDDADDLPYSHTVVLNSWIARRRRSVVFKVSTMYNYKTFVTRSGSKIQHPHDYIQYDIVSRFLDYESEDYVDLLRQICTKRLRQAGVVDSNGETIKPNCFFPTDEKQAKLIDDLRITLKSLYSNKYKGREITDKVYRHLNSEYMKNLNQKRSIDSFIYSGFDTLAILSGGLVRDFIICAQQMYDNTSRQKPDCAIIKIPAAIQNKIVRNHALSVLSEINEVRHRREGTQDDWIQIANIINGLGALFKRKMLSDDAERRVFSFAFQSSPQERTINLLNLAINEGYLIRGFISKKEGSGKRILYVLTRRVGPAFSLDVSAYSGYLSLKPSIIENMAIKADNISPTTNELLQSELPLDQSVSNKEKLISDSDGRETW